MDNPVVEAMVVSVFVAVAFGAWLLWPSLVRRRTNTVKSSEDRPTSQSHTSVKLQTESSPKDPPFPASRSMETENRWEAETAEMPTDKVIIDRERFDKLLAQERQLGMARAFGLLQGAGYLEGVVREKRLTEAKTFLFDGLSGRQMTERINPAIRMAEAEGAARRPAPPQELRTMTVNGEHEIVL